MQASSKSQERKASMQKDIAIVKGMKLTCAKETLNMELKWKGGKFNIKF